MDRAMLLQFLEDRGARSLESYLSEHGADPVAGLEERVQWAAWNFRAPEHEAEARFLMEHHATLRAILDEGETAWHLRTQREARGHASATPPPPRQASPHVEGPPSFLGPRAAPAPPPGPPPVPGNLKTVLYDREPNPAPRPPIEPTTPVTRRPASPLSEASTVIREDLMDQGVQTAEPAPRRSLMPAGLDRTIPDLDDDDDDGQPAPGMEKTGVEGDEEGLGLGLAGPGLIGTPMGAPLRGNAPSDQTALVLALGLSLAGFGALALAAALILNSLMQEPEPAPPPAPPSVQDALQK